MHIDLHVYSELVLSTYSELRTCYHFLLPCYSTSNCTYDSADSIKCHFFSQAGVGVLQFGTFSHFPQYPFTSECLWCEVHGSCSKHSLYHNISTLVQKTVNLGLLIP